jgi:hypothetical protein
MWSVRCLRSGLQNYDQHAGTHQLVEIGELALSRPKTLVGVVFLLLQRDGAHMAR